MSRSAKLFSLPFVKFAAVGFLAFLINAILLEVFALSGVSDWLALKLETVHIPFTKEVLITSAGIAAVLSAEATTIVNFFLQGAYAFSCAARFDRITLTRFFHFQVVSVAAIFVEGAVVELITRLFRDTSAYRLAGLVLAILLFVVPFKWFSYRFLIWNSEK
jgi:putative flippase GtrA